jgi:purine-binding chemotaxis protein CheW
MFNSFLKKTLGAANTVAAPANQQYLTFTLNNEVFALDILVIKEIIQYCDISTVPMMPDYIRGIINLRGAVVPVIDLHVRFGRAAAEVSRRTCIVIIEIDHQGSRHELGIMVDAVSAVIDIAPEQVEPAPRFGSRIKHDFIAGMGKVNEKFVIILDVSKTFTSDELNAMASSFGP